MNKFMKKIMSKKDGFTLVELIVVIAILAILAGVAVPVYSGYIKRANDSAVVSELEAIETAAQAAAAMNGDSVTLIEVTVGGVVKAYTGAGTDADPYVELSITEFYTASPQLDDNMGKHSVYGATGSLGAQWTSTSGSWAAYTTSAVSNG